MAEIQAQAQVEPDPSATSVSNDQTLNETSNQDSTTAVPAAPTTSDDAAKAEKMTEETTEKATEETAGKATEGPAEKDTEATNSDAKDEEKPDLNKRWVKDRGDKRNFKGDSNNRNKKQKFTNVRSNYDDLPESSDPQEIRNQVEFYFSDSNLPTDAYLLAQSGGHENNPIDLKTIHNFKRMRRFQPYSAVLAAVKESTFLNIDEAGLITRKVPLSDKFTDNADANKQIFADQAQPRSIYAKGFGDESSRSQTEIEEFFAPYGTVNAVRLRRTHDGTFKGSVFVEFADEQTAKDFLELDPKPKWNGEEELKIKSKKDYVEEKMQGIRDGTIKPSEPRRNHYDGDRRGRGGGRGGGRGRGGRGGGRGGGGRGGRGGRDRDGGRDRRDRDGDREDRRERRNDRNEEREAENKKRSRDDGHEGGEAKKAKTDE